MTAVPGNGRGFVIGCGSFACNDRSSFERSFWWRLDHENNPDSAEHTVKPVFSDHINQDMF